MSRSFHRDIKTVMKGGTTFFIGLAAAVVLCGGIGDAGAEPLAVPGTGACETVLTKLAAAFNAHHPEHPVSVPPSSGSTGGIRSVIAGEAVLARVARPLRESEAAAGLKYKPFARDLVLFVVGRGVKVRNLTTAQIDDIFSGKILNWREVGGEEAPVRVLTREPDDSSLDVIRGHMAPFRTMVFSTFSKCLYHDHEMVEALAKYRNSIGWLTGSSFQSIKDRAGALAVDGVSPTRQNVFSGTYNLVEEYALVYKPGHLNGAARGFMHFLFSGPGKARMEELGLIPSDEGWSDESN
jgi:phosphate transport system substrate-binding protein